MTLGEVDQGKRGEERKLDGREDAERSNARSEGGDGSVRGESGGKVGEFRQRQIVNQIQEEQQMCQEVWREKHHRWQRWQGRVMSAKTGLESVQASNYKMPSLRGASPGTPPKNKTVQEWC